MGGKEVVTYLGGQLDQDLSGKSMAQKIIHKANASLEFLYRKKMFLKQYCRKTVCMAMIQSRIDYASNLYYHSLPKCLQTRLQFAQNKSITYVLNYSNRTHLVANDFNEVKWMSIENRIKYLAASHVFNYIDEQAPDYLHSHSPLRVHIGAGSWSRGFVSQIFLRLIFSETSISQGQKPKKSAYKVFRQIFYSSLKLRLSKFQRTTQNMTFI